MTSPLGTVLLVDDDAAVRMVLGALVKQAGHEALIVDSGEAALATLERRPVDVVVTDLRMPGMGGMALLRAIAEKWPDVPVVMISAHAAVPDAVEAMKLGAADFIQKPIDRDELLFVLSKVMTAASAAPETSTRIAPSFSGFIGQSRPMQEVSELLQRAARGVATVLLRGESGTGKELAARAIHEGSARAKGPLVRLNCGALPDNLLESELFGYERGAFTGATTRKPGRVELAEGGTLFLDEIGDVTPTLQVKLLRLLQEKTFERLGGNETLKADVRFVAATHQPLEALVEQGRFREDLFYRLNVIPIWLPPLRDRLEDVPALASHFVRVLGEANGRPAATLDPQAMSLLLAQPWPGNARQLQNFVERLVVLSDSESITADDVRRELARGALSPTAPRAPPTATTEGTTLEAQRQGVERAALLDALERAKDNRTLAARLLGGSRRTLYNKLREHGLE